ncbi:hypothetical protein BJX70DRAFT_392685 [Aspergillus crustosus]
MRLCVNRLPLSPPALHRRSFHHVSALAKDKAKNSAIFEDSLEKTLELHRTTNRQGLIRKVFRRSDSENPVQSTPSAGKPPQLDEHVFIGPLASQNQLSKANLEVSRHEDGPMTRESPVGAPVSWSARNGKPKQYPWLVRMEHAPRFTGGFAQLDAELRALEQYLMPTTHEDAVTDQVAANLIKHLTSIESTTGFHIIGSRCTGFAMSDSDVNIMVTFPDGQWVDDFRKPSANRPERLLRYRRFLDQTLSSLEKLPNYRSRGVERLRLLAVDHMPTSVRLRLYCGEHIPASLHYIQDFHAEYPTLRAMYMATRLILESRRAFRHVIDPLALQMLIAAFLKMNHGRFRRDAAEPLLLFLHTLGTEVDFTSSGVAVDPPGFFTTESVKEESAQYSDLNDLPAHLRGQRALLKSKRRAAAGGDKAVTGRLCLQDPANYMKDLGSLSSRTPDMQSAFADAGRRLVYALDSWEPSRPLSARTSILGAALRTNFEDFEARRAKIVGTGLGL